MSPLPRRLALLALCAAGPWACGSAPGPQQPPANTPPTLRLFLPDGPMPLRVGERVEFQAAVEDAEEGAALRERVVWVSSREGQLAHGARASLTFQEAGPRTLTASVVDSGGQAASASLTFEVLARGAPDVSVRKPAPGSAFNLGEPLELECHALGVSGAPLSADAVQWTSALTGSLPGGSARLVVAGEDTLTCTATDPATHASASASVRVTVRPTLAPAVLITLPERTEVYVKAGEPAPFSPSVRFRATAQDFNAAGGAGNLDGAIQWTLEPGGVALGTGAAVTHTFTTPGEYTVTARAVDGRGSAAVDSVRVRLVGNLPPRCEIDTPHDDHIRLRRDVASPLAGRCVDPETEAPLPVTWRTSASPTALGTGEALDAVFMVSGAQVLSACAVDPADAALKGCAERPVHVIVNSAPADCAIQSPGPAAVVNAGRPLALEGSASDAQDPRGDLRFEWTSSRDGALGQGASTTTHRLSTPGSHQLTLTVTDPWGQACTAAVAVQVNGAPEVRVDSVRQGSVSCLENPCREDQPVYALGFVRDADAHGGIADLAWLDSLGGSVSSGQGNTPGASFPTPLPGRHTLVLLAENRAGAVGRAAVSFTILPSGRPRLLEEVLPSDKPVVALALAEGTLHSADGESSEVRRARTPSEVLPVGAPAVALFTLRSTEGEVLFVGTRGGGVLRCEDGACARFTGGSLATVDNEVTSVAALASPDLLLLGTPRGLILTRATDPSAGGHPGVAAGRRVLEGREVRQVVISPASTASQVKAWAATSAGLAELTVRVEAGFEPALAAVSVAIHRPPGIPDEDVLSVAVGPEGQVFAGTRRGFGAPGRPGPVLRDAPWHLPDEEVQTLLFERQASGTRDVLWAGTRDGLVRYDVTRDIVTHFGTGEGLPHAGVRALLKGPDGVRYFGTERGVASYGGD